MGGGGDGRGSDLAAPDGGPSSRQRLAAHSALIAFLFVELAAFIEFLRLSRHHWFFVDDWAFVANRDGGSLHDLLRPHNEHWSTIPVVVFRILFRTFGINTYTPYKVTVLLLHLTAAVLLRAVMRRAGAGPWVATAVASTFALLGSGADNIVWAFQIGFTGALVFGLGYLLLADHDGRFDRRDAVGMGLGLASLMCSGVGITMVVIVTFAVLLRRGWRLAIVHAVPLAIVFAVWFLGFARSSYARHSGNHSFTPKRVARYAVSGARATMHGLGRGYERIPNLWFPIVVIIVIGALLLRREIMSRRPRLAAPVALFFGSGFFLVLTSAGRAGEAPAHAHIPSRYVYIVAALVLPLIAVEIQAISVRWRAVGVVATAVLLAGIPGNIKALSDRDASMVYASGKRAIVLALPHVPFAHEIPPDTNPFPEAYRSTTVTIGWFLEAEREGRMPTPRTIAPWTMAEASFRLSIAQTSAPARRIECPVLRKSEVRHLQLGDRFTLYGGLVRITPIGLGPFVNGVVFSPARGHLLAVVHGPLDVRISSVRVARPPEVCE